MVLPPVAVVAVFIGFPVVAAIAYTLGRAGGPNSTVALLAQRQHIVHHGVTGAAYREVLGNPHVRTDLWATIWVTLLTIVAVVILSWSIALYLRLSDNRMSKIVSALSVIPLFIPVVAATNCSRRTPMFSLPICCPASDGLSMYDVAPMFLMSVEV